MKNKKALEMSFAWIFSIAVGAIILLLAIYFAINLVNTSTNEINTKTAREFVNILDPLQTSVEEGRTQRVELVSDTRIYLDCSESGNFGKNTVRFSEKTGFKDTYGKPGGDIKTEAHYIFSENVIEGKKIYFFVKPFKLGFKVADLMFMYSDRYCFVNAPDSIIEESSGLFTESNSNIEFKNSLNDCGNTTKNVCFGLNSKGCDILVEGACNSFNCQDIYSNGFVEKNGKSVYYTDNLLYAAIFSDVDNYECNLKRIMKRTSDLSEIYAEKARFISVRGCETDLIPELNLMNELSSNFKDDKDLAQIQILGQEIDNKNIAVCKLF